MNLTDDEVRRVERIARGWLQRHAGDLCDADRNDVVQDALLHVLEQHAERPCPLATRVTFAVLNATKRLRFPRSCEVMLEDEVEDYVEQPYWFGEEFVERAGLTEKQLRACRLRLDGLTTNEASAVLGITPRAFRMRLRRTRAQIECVKQRS